MRPYNYLVLGVNPTANENEVLLNARVEIKFAKHIDTNTLNENNIRLRKVNGDFVEYEGIYNSNKMSYILRPTENFAPSTQYQVEIVGGAEGICSVDLNYLPMTKTYEFTTVALSGISEIRNLRLEQDYLFVKAKWDMPEMVSDSEVMTFDVKISKSSEPLAECIWPSNEVAGTTSLCELDIPVKLEPKNNYFVHVQVKTSDAQSEWVTEQIYIEPIESSSPDDSGVSPGPDLPPSSFGDQIEIVEHSPQQGEFTLQNELMVVFSDAFDTEITRPDIMPLGIYRDYHIQVKSELLEEMDPFVFEFDIKEWDGSLPQPRDTEDEFLEPGKLEVIVSLNDEQIYKPEEAVGEHRIDMASRWDSLEDGYHEFCIMYQAVRGDESILIEEKRVDFYKSRFKFGPYLYVVQAPYKASLTTLDLLGKYSYKNAIPADVRVHEEADNVLVWKALDPKSITSDVSYTAVISKKTKGVHTLPLGYTYTFGFVGTPEHLHGDLSHVRETLMSFEEYFSDKYLLQLMSEHSRFACDVWSETSSYDSSLHQDGKAPYFIDKYVNIQTAIDALINLGAGNINGLRSESMTLSELSISKGAPDYGNIGNLLEELRKRLKPWQDLVHGHHNRGYAKSVVANRAEAVESYEEWHERTDMKDFDS